MMVYIHQVWKMQLMFACERRITREILKVVIDGLVLGCYDLTVQMYVQI